MTNRIEILILLTWGKNILLFKVSQSKQEETKLTRKNQNKSKGHFNDIFQKFWNRKYKLENSFKGYFIGVFSRKNYWVNRKRKIIRWFTLIWRKLKCRE